MTTNAHPCTGCDTGRVPDGWGDFCAACVLLLTGGPLGSEDE